MTTPCVVRVGVDLPGEARDRLIELRSRFPAGVRWVAPTELRVTLCVSTAPGTDSLDALRLVLRRLAIKTAPFEAALRSFRARARGDGHRLSVDVSDDAGALERLGAELCEALVAYGFDATGEPPCVLLGRHRGEAPPASPAMGAQLAVPVEAFHWECLDAATGAVLHEGTVEFDRTPPAQQAATADRERSALDAELQRRLARRPRPPRPKTNLLKAGPPKAAAIRNADPDSDGDDATEGDDDESDDATD